MIMAIDPCFRRLGDLVAGTIVVSEEPSTVASTKPLTPDAEALEALPGSLPLDRDDLEAIELFVHREQMSDPRREELAEIVAGEYARRLHLPPPRHPAAFLAAIWVRAQDPKRRIVP